MKLFYCAIILFFTATLTAKSFAREFVMDCGTREAFVGQKMLCQFIFFSDEDFVEIEVVKFPEFRGFWSENTTMRQGPMGLLSLPTPQGVRKQAIVGSYVISQMAGKTNEQIIPMKISVKGRPLQGGWSRESSDVPQIMSSSSTPIKSIPLPLIPRDYFSIPFKGIVGDFRIHQSEVTVNYRLEEAVNFKVSIEGQGNFAELNSLPLDLPSNSELVSERTFLQNIGDSLIKTFEFSVLIKSSPPGLHSLGSFLFFNPRTRSYQRLSLPNLKFVLAPPLEKTVSSDFQLPSPETEWAVSTSPLTHLGIILMQFVIALLLSFVALRNHLLKLTAKKRASLAFQREQKWIQARQALQSGDPQKAIQLATHVFTELLKEKSLELKPLPSRYPTQKSLLQVSQDSFSEEQLKGIRDLFEAYNERFSPSLSSSPQPVDLAPLESALLKTNKYR